MNLKILVVGFSLGLFTVIMTRLLAVVAAFDFTRLLGLAKAIDYSFYVPEPVEFELEGKCYAIENQPTERLNVTDCGGYLNVLQSTFTLGLSLSSERTLKAAMQLKGQDSKYEGCNFRKWKTWAAER